MHTIGAAKSTDIVPNAEFNPTAPTLASGTATADIDLSSLSGVHTAMIVADKPFYCSRLTIDSSKMPIIDPATTPIYYHPINGCNLLHVGAAGAAVAMKITIFMSHENAQAG